MASLDMVSLPEEASHIYFFFNKLIEHIYTYTKHCTRLWDYESKY